MDEQLSTRLSEVKARCFVGNVSGNHLMYADDLCCFSSSMDSLQDLLNVCSHYAVEHDMVINNDKSVETLFRSKRFALSCVPNCRIGDEVIKFCSSVKYLGYSLMRLNQTTKTLSDK